MYKGKTVYILGAGCSRADGMPVQADILKQIFLLKLEEKNIDIEQNLIDISIKMIPQQYVSRYELFEKSRCLLAQFLLANFGTTGQKNRMQILLTQFDVTLQIGDRTSYMAELYYMAAELQTSLEDIFTIFDKVDLQGEHWRDYSRMQISEVNDALKKCIIYTVCYQMEQIEKRDTYQKFADLLIKERVTNGQKNDGLSVITMNWDTLLEQELYKKCISHQKKLMPDYCFYSYPFNEKREWVPSTLLKTKKYYNIKILKLHGSFNWLVCPRCGRILVDFDDNISNYILGADQKALSYCRYCSNNYELEKRPELESLFVSPTYLKVFQDSNIKNIWHNAFIELSEATKIIFVGYSFPNADFEFKHLLKETINPECSIQVVLTQNDDLEYYRNLLSKIDEKSKNFILKKIDLPFYRYNNFFGEGRIEYHYKGVQEYLKGLEL